MHHHHARTHIDNLKCLLISTVGVKAANLLLLLRLSFLTHFMLMPHMFAVSASSVLPQARAFVTTDGDQLLLVCAL